LTLIFVVTILLITVSVRISDRVKKLRTTKEYVWSARAPVITNIIPIARVTNPKMLRIVVEHVMTFRAYLSSESKTIWYHVY
jgi:hypothetical protein